MRRRLASVAAENPVPSEQPELADPGDGWASDVGNGRLRSARRYCAERFDPQIDLADVEADRLDVEVERDARQLQQLLGQPPVIPCGDLRQPVVGDRESPSLRLGETLELNGWNLAPPQTPRRLQASMAGDHVEIAIDKNRDVEPERRNAVGDLANLPGAVPARVFGIRLQPIRGKVGYR